MLTSHLPIPLLLQADPYTDTNHNNKQCKPITESEKTVVEFDKYSLRPRSVRRCRKHNDEENQAPAAAQATTASTTKPKKSKQKPAPLSKYRRRTANARERCRMQEINQAFEALRRVVPQLSCEDTSKCGANEKLTKITTLRLAMQYISSLSAALDEPVPELYSDIDLLLDSDGESLPIYTDFSSDRSLTSDFSVELDANEEDSLNAVDLHLEPYSLSADLPHHISTFDPFLSGFS